MIIFQTSSDEATTYSVVIAPTSGVDAPRVMGLD